MARMIPLHRHGEQHVGADWAALAESGAARRHVLSTRHTRTHCGHDYRRFAASTCRAPPGPVRPTGRHGAGFMLTPEPLVSTRRRVISVVPERHLMHARSPMDATSERRSQRAKTPYEEAAAHVEWFLEFLRRHGTEPSSEGCLERACLVLLELNTRRFGPQRDLLWPDLRADLQYAVGIYAMIRRLWLVREHHDIETVLPHLRLLAATRDENPSPGASTSGRAHDANKIFELLGGLAALSCGDEVEIDHPVRSSRRKKPDVTFRGPDGQRWGLEFKVLHGENPRALFGLFEKGVDQIEAGDCELGLVVVGVKNHLPHEALMPHLGTASDGTPLVGTHRDLSELQRFLRGFAHDRITAMLDAVTRDAVWAKLLAAKALPGILCVAATTAVVRTEHGPMPSLVTEALVEQLEFSRLILESRFTPGVKRFLLQLIAGMT